MTALSDSDAQPLPDNPLPPCPDTPNCERVSEGYEQSPEVLYSAAQEALDSLGPATLRLHPEERRVEAVYRVALVFKDDVDVAVRARADSGSALYIRSASRVGYDDLGVNRRRVERFFEALHQALDNT
ncbi:MAG: DUF1499 domain-containing protein [Salinibacter sp.]|uniref:DUF1499 domain-containing protein n=1 Tax=Salinibacter sp. TaxID=2065818 RepID=UPI0035D44449